MNHYTSRKGFKAISAAPTWIFKARKQRGTTPFGAYFTTLHPSHPNFWKRVRLPKKKREFMFSFVDVHDLLPLRGPRGKDVFYAPVDYAVAQDRQVYAGSTDSCPLVE